MRRVLGKKVHIFTNPLVSLHDSLVNSVTNPTMNILSVSMHQIPRFLVVVTASFFFVFQTQAQDLESKVKALFQERCQECHHPDTNDDYPYLHNEVAIEDLIEDEALVPGDPGESAIFRRVTLEPDSRKRMPKSRGAEGDESYRPPLTQEEQDLIKNWIAGIGETKPEPPTTVTKTEPKTTTPPPTEPNPPTAPAEEKKEEPKVEVTASVSDDENKMPSGVSLEEKVHWIFQQRCSKCHEGDYEPELTGTISLAAFFSEKNADGSGLMADTVVERTLRDSDEDGRMPKSKGDPGSKSYRPPLADEEREALRKWADAGRPKAVKRDFIANSDIIKAIYDDLDGASEAEQKFFRYLTLTNLYNATDAQGNALVPDLDPHRAAVSKLINSLSYNAKITRPVAIDEAQTIYRIDLRDYDWDDDLWETVISYYPYGILGIDRQKEKLIERYTGSRMAYLRADWFTFAASQPPLYDDIIYDLLSMNVDKDSDNVIEALEGALGIDRYENLQSGNAMRAGFQFSGVSEANRLIERHELGTHQGSYWISYDFTPLSPKRNHDLKLAPLGPPEAGLTDDENHAFQHDGGEIVFSLPNGLQGYMLATHDGKRLDRGPIEIVQDDNRQDNVIINGISCMACHDQGIKPALRVADVNRRTLETMTDEVRPLVESAGILDFKESKLLEKLYPEPYVLQAAIKEDFNRFVQAEAEAVGNMAASTEPTVGLYNDFRSPVTARKLASEFGMQYDELIKMLDDESDTSETLSVISTAMSRDLPFRRENLLREYIAVVYALGYELMPFVPLGYEDFGGQKYADLIAESDQYLSAFGGADYDYDTAKKTVLTTATASETLATESVLLHGGGKMKVSIQPKLKVGERAKLTIVATKDTHIRVFHFSSDSHVTELFPGSTGKGSFRPKNKKLEVSWETTPPAGAEHVIVYAAGGEIKNIARGTKVGDFIVYNKDDVFSTRGIPKAIRVAEVKDETSTAVPAQISQAKIGYILTE